MEAVMIHIWLNVATFLCLVGIVVYLTCLRSTTWYDDDDT